MSDLPRCDLKAGDLVHVGRAASVQFGGSRGMYFRVVKVMDLITYHGWVWLDGYQLNAALDAVARRQIFVLIDGVRRVQLQRPVPQIRRSVRQLPLT